jgi:hypothetical protein
VQIAVKAAEGRVKDASNVVRRVVRRALPDAPVAVRQLFPEAATGQRARLFVVEIPDDRSPADVQKLVDALNGDAAIEYASMPSPKSPADE